MAALRPLARLMESGLFCQPESPMIAPDPLSQCYRPLLENTYDVVDRIVLSAYFGLGSSPGGFRLWWHQGTARRTTSTTPI